MLISTRIDQQTRLGNLRTVIVDEFHTFAADDRSWHLRSVLHRLTHHLRWSLWRIGL